MKTILVPTEQHTLMTSVLETALLLARRFDSYVEGFAVGLDIPEAVSVDLVIGLPSILDHDTRQGFADGARAFFENFMAARDVPRRAGSPGLSHGWRDGELHGDSFVGSHARVFDVTVLGRPSTRSEHPRMITLEAALFESGRPILIAPPTPPSTLGESILVAWNGSTETSRAVAVAMPLLLQARQVIVLSVEGGMVPGPSGVDLARALRQHGVPAEAATRPDPARRSGEAFLTAAAEAGCDLVIKGAYTQSRLRQMIFGGATSHILAATQLPVFMAH